MRQPSGCDDKMHAGTKLFFRLTIVRLSLRHPQGTAHEGHVDAATFSRARCVLFFGLTEDGWSLFQFQKDRNHPCGRHRRHVIWVGSRFEKVTVCLLVFVFCCVSEGWKRCSSKRHVLNLLGVRRLLQCMAAHNRYGHLFTLEIAINASPRTKWTWFLLSCCMMTMNVINPFSTTVFPTPLI